MNPALANPAMNVGSAPVGTPYFFYGLAAAAIISGLLVITRVDQAAAVGVMLLEDAGHDALTDGGAPHCGNQQADPSCRCYHRNRCTHCSARHVADEYERQCD